MRPLAPLLLLALSCGGPRPAVESIPRAGTGHGDLVGSYLCSMEDYPPFACIVTEDGAELRLEKLTGSVRFRGTLAATPDGLLFQGVQFCPWGACDCEVEGELRPGDHPHEWFGRLHRADPEVVDVSFRLWRDDGTGGEPYGGGGYGGVYDFSDDTIEGDLTPPCDDC